MSLAVAIISAIVGVAVGALATLAYLVPDLKRVTEQASALRASVERGFALPLPLKYIHAAALRVAAGSVRQLADQSKGMDGADAVRGVARALDIAARDLNRDAIDEASDDELALIARFEKVDLVEIAPKVTP